MLVSTLAALAMFAAQEPAQSAPSSAPETKSVDAKAEAPKKMCYTATPSGSRMPRKVCVTQAPAKDKDEKSEPKPE
jgi:hypothetical protein